MAGEGLYLMAVAEDRNGPVLMVSLGPRCLLTLAHPEALSLLEQFRALRSVEARNAFGDALLLMARFVAEGAVVGLP